MIKEKLIIIFKQHMTMRWRQILYDTDLLFYYMYMHKYNGQSFK